jgi:hypothetical protein
VHLLLLSCCNMTLSHEHRIECSCFFSSSTVKIHSVLLPTFWEKHELASSSPIMKQETVLFIIN